MLVRTEAVGLDVRTTATLLGISSTAVRVPRHRGLGTLRHPGGATAARASLVPAETV